MKVVLLLLVMSVACKQKPEAAPAPPPVGSATAAPVATVDATREVDAAEGDTGQYKMTKDQPRQPTSGFARVDDAAAGKAPWITDAEAKAGIVELVVDGKGTATTKRLCGDAAKQAMAKVGEILAKRMKDESLDQIVCLQENTDENQRMCLSKGGEGELAVLPEYRQVGGTWTLVGVRSVDMTADTKKQDAAYEKLLTAQCK